MQLSIASLTICESWSGTVSFYAVFCLSTCIYSYNATLRITVRFTMLHAVKIQCSECSIYSFFFKIPLFSMIHSFENICNIYLCLISRVFRPSDLIVGEVIGKGFFGQVSKVYRYVNIQDFGHLACWNGTLRVFLECRGNIIYTYGRPDRKQLQKVHIRV